MEHRQDRHSELFRCPARYIQQFVKTENQDLDSDLQISSKVREGRKGVPDLFWSSVTIKTVMLILMVDVYWQIINLMMQHISDRTYLSDEGWYQLVRVVSSPLHTFSLVCIMSSWWRVPGQQMLP